MLTMAIARASGSTLSEDVLHSFCAARAGSCTFEWQP
jgi:hypothetical protein